MPYRIALISLVLVLLALAACKGDRAPSSGDSGHQTLDADQLQPGAQEEVELGENWAEKIAGRWLVDSWSVDEVKIEKYAKENGLEEEAARDMVSGLMGMMNSVCDAYEFKGSSYDRMTNLGPLTHTFEFVRQDGNTIEILTTETSGMQGREWLTYKRDSLEVTVHAGIS